MASRPADAGMEGRGPWMRLIGGLMLLGAIVCIAVAVRLMWLEGPDNAALPPTDSPDLAPLGIAAVAYATPLPTIPPRPTLAPVNWIHPTADAAAIALALDSPVITAPQDGTIQRDFTPLTIIPARSRSTVITYSVRKGDTLRGIADRFGLDESTIIWSNDRFYVNAMRIGLELTILPVDGVYHRVRDSQSVAQIADTYQVDPYTIIDSEYNTLYGASPQTVLPEGYVIVVPGGKGSTEPIYWDPGITMTSSGAVGTGVSAGSEFASFAVGDPGSCGRQAVSGGSLPVSAPLYARYRITQDYVWNHGGIDLAVPIGTPVYAAGGGTVIFSGMSTWGYGYTVVIAHGGTLSLYGHLNGAFVSCGQVVTAGQNIAVTGNSGRSSGPHLHFEIRGASGVPVNPWDYQRF